MGSKFRFFVLYFLSWLFFFNLLRALFLSYHSDKTTGLSASQVLGTFTHGLRMDLSMAAYLLLPLCLFVLLSLFIPFFRRQVIYKVYTAFVLLLILLIALSDLEIYRAWGFRMDATPLKFLSTPREAIASMSHLPLTRIMIGFLVILIGLIWFYSKMISRFFFASQYQYRTLTAIVILIFMGALIIPVRGGLQLAPLNQSSVYFSTNNFANHAAINPVWNFLHSVFSKENIRTNPYQYFSKPVFSQIVDSLYRVDSASPRLIDSTDKPVNVILVIWESFTEKAIHLSRNGKEITPSFNLLKKEGVYFSNVYATGDRTNKGVPAILSGYPAMPNTTIIHSPGKLRNIHSLSELFRSRGYQSTFIYGGEPEFANLKSYLINSKFDPIIGRDDFTEEDMNSKWGAHDGVVMERLLAELNQQPAPFFTTWLTLSSHEPFETPVPAAIPGDDIESKFLNSLHYTDQVIGNFIQKCRQQSWWNNTLIIITGDHGSPLPETGMKADNFRTPMLWLGGAVAAKDKVIENIISQIDIPAIVSHQLKMDPSLFPFSKYALNDKNGGWAFFDFNDGFGYIDSKGRIVFDNIGNRIIKKDGQAEWRQERAGKALMQYYYQDFIER